MRWSWITAILNTILPRHPRAERAVSIDPQVLARLLEPKPLSGAPWVTSLFPYRDEQVRALIQAVKYYGEQSVTEKVAPFVADYLTELVAQKVQYEGWRSPVLVPIPSSPSRLRQRGYNQAALFARAALVRVPELRLDESLLSREERTSQVHVSRALRRHNMEHAFQASHRAAGAFIILIDDVAESGATMLDARRALLDEGAKDVVGVAIAH